LLHCEECGCVSEDALGWIATVIDDEEQLAVDPYVVSYCPPCAEREFERAPRTGYV
jgi:hypothetical protein